MEHKGKASPARLESTSDSPDPSNLTSACREIQQFVCIYNSSFPFGPVVLFFVYSRAGEIRTRIGGRHRPLHFLLCYRPDIHVLQKPRTGFQSKQSELQF